MPFWTIVGSIAAAGVGFLALVWAVTRYWIERPPHEVLEMQEAIARAAETRDPLEHLYRALACERLARRYYPSRREFWLFGSFWLWTTLAISPFATADVARHFAQDVAIWVILLLFMVAVFLGGALATYFTREFIRNVGWGTEAVHLKLVDLLVAERAHFLERSEHVPEHKEPRALKAVWAGLEKPRTWAKQSRPPKADDPSG